MEESQPISRERSVVFSIYLVAVFLNAFVDLGHKIIIQIPSLWSMANSSKYLRCV